jgi:hypothetical protein
VRASSGLFSLWQVQHTRKKAGTNAAPNFVSTAFTRTVQPVWHCTAYYSAPCTHGTSVKPAGDHFVSAEFDTRVVVAPTLTLAPLILTLTLIKLR